MMGDPQTAKSQTLCQVMSTAELAIGTTGSGVSGMGCKAVISLCSSRRSITTFLQTNLLYRAAKTITLFKIMNKKDIQLMNQIVTYCQKDQDLIPLMRHVTGFRCIAYLLSYYSQEYCAQNKISAKTIQYTFSRLKFEPKKDTLQFQDEVVQLFMSKPDDSPATLKFIRCLSELYPKVSFLFSNRKLSTLFLENLYKVSCQIRSLFFLNCEIAARLPQFLQDTSLNCLRSLCITSDNLTNSNLKALIKKQLPSLSRLSLNNTNITSDCIRLLAIRPQKGFEYLIICPCPNFDYNFLNKEFAKMNLTSSQSLFLSCRPSERSSSFVYIEYCAKYQLIDGKKRNLTLSLNAYKQYTNIEQNMLNSDRTFENIEQVMFVGIN